VVHDYARPVTSYHTWYLEAMSGHLAKIDHYLKPERWPQCWASCRRGKCSVVETNSILHALDGIAMGHNKLRHAAPERQV
jgi:hypothetical protein